MLPHTAQESRITQLVGSSVSSDISSATGFKTYYSSFRWGSPFHKLLQTNKQTWFTYIQLSTDWKTHRHSVTSCSRSSSTFKFGPSHQWSDWRMGVSVNKRKASLVLMSRKFRSTKNYWSEEVESIAGRFSFQELNPEPGILTTRPYGILNWDYWVLYYGNHPYLSLSPIWSSGQDSWFSPRRPGFNSRYGK